jgi:uncharacterized protein UPF0259
LAITYPALPAMGPLVGSSFDRALTVMAREWRGLAIVAVVAIGSSAINFAIGECIGIGLLVYWYYHSLANAVRLVDPAFAMKAEHVLRLIGINFVYGICVEVGFLLLIVPGIYVANKWSLSSLIAVRENTGAFDALSRSWAVTDAFFWPTLGFNILSGLGVLGVGIVGYLIMVFVWVALLGGDMRTAGDVWTGGGIRGMALAAGVFVYILAIAYTYQAKDIAMLNWYNALRRALNPAGTVS